MGGSSLKIGVLALQGAVEPHFEKLEKLGATPILVKKENDLEGLAGIILPGGESTTILHLLKLNQLWNPLKTFAEKRPTWGICAGAILLAKEVSHPVQDSLAILSAAVERNAYGRQVASFIGPLEPTPFGKERFGSEPIEGVFIRAPKFHKLGTGVMNLFEQAGEPVMIQQGHCLASAFHPELSAGTRLHEYFVNQCQSAS